MSSKVCRNIIKTIKQDFNFVLKCTILLVLAHCGAPSQLQDYSTCYGTRRLSMCCEYMTIDKWKCIDPNEWCISDEVLYGPQLSHFPLKNFWLRWDLNPGLPVEKPALYPLLHELTLKK